MIRVQYGGVWGPDHGGRGGSITNYKLEPEEKIIIVQGRSGGRLDQLEFITDAGRVLGPVGGSGGGPWVAARPTCQLSYLSGSAGSRLDSLTLHWECP